jgi:hypothetical protein
MGQVSTEQVVAIIDAVQPDTIVQQTTPEFNPWWFSLFLVIVPVILAPFVTTWVQRKRNK